MLRVALLALALIVPACATRQLTETERAFVDTVHGDTVDLDAVTVVDGAVVGLIRRTRPPRPQTACRERLFPPETGPITTSFAAFVLDETIHYSTWAHEPDFLEGYPDELPLRDAMRLAHELTHVWQWQQRARTGYHPFKALTEQTTQADPYLFELDETRKFLDYGWEQQGIIVEEYVCCRALDPDGPRTARLRSVLAEHFPVLHEERAVNVQLPWDGAETAGICS
ncbi:MAG: hypothetical protein AAFR35_10825 [Pseudomonadota bacterium]